METDQNDVTTSQGMLRIASSHWKVKAWNRFSL